MSTLAGEASRGAEAGLSMDAMMQSLEETLTVLARADWNAETAGLIEEAKRQLDGVLLSTVERGVALNRLRNAQRYFEAGFPGAAHYELGMALAAWRRTMSTEAVCERRRRLRTTNEKPVTVPIREVTTRPDAGGGRKSAAAAVTAMAVVAVLAVVMAAAASVVAVESTSAWSAKRSLRGSGSSLEGT